MRWVVKAGNPIASLIALNGRLRCLAISVFLFFAVVFSCSAQESEGGPYDTLGPWKITNTILFVIGFGFLIYKYAPAFFNARAADIQKAIKDATGLKIEADFRYSEIDRKMATLADEVKKMRAQSALEMEREHARVRRDTEQSIQHIRQNVAAEIEALRLEGVRNVRQHTARAALAIAEQRLRERLAGGESEDVVQDFVRLVERGRN